jgi:acyl-CoA thioester hydrolase
MERPMCVEIDIRIKAYEIDAMGIVSNIIYVKWVEDLRHLVLEKYYPYTDMMREKKSPILIKTEIEYKKPFTILDVPKGKLWFSKLDKMRWEINFEFGLNDVVHCKGKQFGCFFDLDKNKITSMPEWFVDIFRKELEM